MGYFINGTVNAMPSVGGVVATVTLPVTGNYIILVMLNFGNTSSTNKMYFNINGTAGNFYGTSTNIDGVGFLAFNNTIFYANTGSTAFNINLTYNGTPNFVNSSYITAVRIG
jgi:hypothetical protein